MNLSTHCPDCFKKKENCSHNFNLEQINNHVGILPPFTTLDNNRYYIGRVLGRGGFGIVYAGYNTSSKSSIAIKEFFPITNHLAIRNQDGLTVEANSKKIEEFTYWRDQFLKEAKLLYELTHPNIIRLYTILENENGTTYLIMERLRGATLAEYLKVTHQDKNIILFNKRLTENEAKIIFITAIQALKFLHNYNEEQVIHLDINPNNIFIKFDKNGKLDQLKLLDFGLARNINFQQNINDVVVGNPFFMAPEQIKLDAKNPITASADCYSLGACMYAALNGQIPTTIARLNGTPLADLNSQLSNVQDKALIETIMACLNLDATQRPQHAMELYECLENADLRDKYLNKKLSDLNPVESGNTILLEQLPKDDSNIIEAIPEVIPSEPTNLEFPNQVPKYYIAKNIYKVILLLIFIFIILLTYCNLFHSISTPSYQINDDGTVLDTKNNLWWKRCSEGQIWNEKTCTGYAQAMNWNEIMPNGKPKTWNNFAEQNDWRLPTIEELHSLVLCNNSNSCNENIINENIYYNEVTIDKTLFPNTPIFWFWSTSIENIDAKNIQVVYFGTGEKYWTNSSNYGYVRLVKTGNTHSYNWNEMILYCKYVLQNWLAISL